MFKSLPIFNESKLVLGGIALILADNAKTNSPRNGKIIRCKICDLELGYEDIEYVLEGTDQMALIAGPCKMSRNYYTIQQIPTNRVPPDIRANKKVLLHVGVRDFDEG